MFLVVELNGSTSRRAFASGAELRDTGGTTVFLSPGIQYITRRVIYEASVQIPIVQNLNGAQVETDFVTAAGIRIQF